MAAEKIGTVVSMWVTEDVSIPAGASLDNRYDEAVDGKLSVYKGRYRMWQTYPLPERCGFEADGDFVDGELHHIGMRFHPKTV